MKKIFFFIFFFLLSTSLFASQDLSLKQGWNLKGSSLDDVNIEQFQNEDILTVWKWDGSNWKIWSPDPNVQELISGYGLNSITNINSGEGFWVNTKSDTSITLLGYVSSNYTITIKDGWQLLALPFASPYFVDNLKNIEGIKTIWKWNNANWEVWSPNEEIQDLILNYGLDSFDTIYIGEGFWLSASLEGATSISFNPPNVKFIAVDPYIQGATFFEDTNNNGVLDEGEQVSTSSNENGEFFFKQPPSPSSTIVMLNPGIENGEVFEGLLKSKYDNDTCDNGTCIVSPLTTLLANGMTKEQIINILEQAGITISPEDFKKDPLKNIKELSNISLKRLQVSMALNGFMNILKALGKNGFYMTYEDFDNETINNYLKPFINIIKNILSPQLLQEIKAQLPANISLPPLTGDILVKVAHTLLNYIVKDSVDKIISGEVPNFSEYTNIINEFAAPLVKKYYAVLNFNNDKIQQWINNNPQMFKNIGKHTRFKIENGKIKPFIFGSPIPFTKLMLNNRVYAVTDKEENAIYKFYDNNTFEYFAYCFKCSSEPDIEKESGFWNIDNKTGALILKSFNKSGELEEIGKISIISKNINSILVKITYKENGVLKTDKEFWQKTYKFEDIHNIAGKGWVVYFQIPNGHFGRVIYNKIDNLTGLGTGKMFIFDNKKVFSFKYYLNHTTGELVRIYQYYDPNEGKWKDGNILEVYPLPGASEKICRGITKMTNSEGNILSIQKVFIFMNSFNLSFNENMLLDKLFVIEEYSKDQYGNLYTDYSLVTFNQNYTFSAIYSDNNSIENETDNWELKDGIIYEDDGSWHKLVGYNQDTNIMIVDNHYPDENYLHTVTIEKWAPAKPFSDIIGTYLNEDNDTVVFYDNNTGVFINGFDNSTVNFIYSLSEDHKRIDIKDVNNTPIVSLYFEYFDTTKNGLKLIHVDYGKKEISAHIWVKQ